MLVFQIQEADLLQVAGVMGLEEKIDVTDDIGSADAILASSYEMKQNPWIRGVAKFHQLPVFVIKVCQKLFFAQHKAWKLMLIDDTKSALRWFRLSPPQWRKW